MMGHDLKEEEILMDRQIINQNVFAGTTIPKVKRNLPKAPSMQNASLFMHCSINLKKKFSFRIWRKKSKQKNSEGGGEE